MYSGMMPADQRADNCVECGECEEKCPQQIEIIENLKQAHQLLYKDLTAAPESR
jgi:predicted aldo/keto reductase-like oxidoreductase